MPPIELETIINNRLNITKEKITEFCQRWKVAELSLFGSVLREDFHNKSDVDVLIAFVPNHGWHLFDFMNMQRELEEMFGRSVDLIQKKELQNPYRRAEVLQSHRVIYAGQQS